MALVHSPLEKGQCRWLTGHPGHKEKVCVHLCLYPCIACGIFRVSGEVEHFVCSVDAESPANRSCEKTSKGSMQKGKAEDIGLMLPASLLPMPDQRASLAEGTVFFHN